MGDMDDDESENMHVEDNLYAFKPFVFKVAKPSCNNHSDISIPCPRSGHRLVSCGASIYVFGGYNPNINREDYPDDLWQMTNPLFQELWQFNTVSSQWTRLRNHDNMPCDSLASYSAFVIGSSMMVFGGTAVPFGNRSSNLIYRCHLPSGEWYPYPMSGNMPTPMYGQAICLDGVNLYVVGGTTGYEYSMDVHRGNLEEQIWTLLRPNTALSSYILPEDRYRHEIVYHNGCLLVFGGGQVDFAAPLKKLPSFNLDVCGWTLQQTYPDRVTKLFPNRRRCHALVRHNNYVYIHGGYDGRTNFGDLWRLDLRTFKWLRLSTTTIPLFFHAATLTKEGCLYIFGGIGGEEMKERSNAMFKCWLEIPSLKTICWEALFQYAPHLIDLPAATLLQAGIPSSIVNDIYQQVPAACG